jgi:ATP-binding cassette, subfamily B, bacterial
MSDSAATPIRPRAGLAHLISVAARADGFALRVGVVAAMVSAVLGATFPWIYSRLVDGAVAGHGRTILVAAVAIAAAQAASMGLRAVSGMLTWNLFEKMTILVDQDLVDLTTRLRIVEDVQEPDFQDRLTLARTNREHFQESMSSLLYALLLCLELLVTIVLLVSVAPLLLLLPLVAVAPIVASRWTEGRAQRALRECLPDTRAADGLALLAFDPRAAGELRVLGLAGDVQERQRDAWRRTVATQWRAELAGALVTAGALVLFTAGFAGALLYVTRRSLTGEATLGEVILVLTAGQQLHSQLGSLLANAGALFRIVETMRHLVWLEQYVDRLDRLGVETPPAHLHHGIELRDVCFRYRGAEQDAVCGVSLVLPAGSVVAVVGDNGAGKSTLVAMLAGLHRPTAGNMFVDGCPADRLDLDAWRGRVTAAFQEFMRYELLAREAVGLGAVDQIDDNDSVRAALLRADVDELQNELPQGLATPLGGAFLEGGVDLSGGQWQKLALGRTMMRERPLLLLLDEPTAALDAHAEHVLFEQYAESARAAAETTGAITLLISHRFSTVRMADLILVVDGGRIVERGTHDELMALRGMYAELYELQARAYA